MRRFGPTAARLGLVALLAVGAAAAWRWRDLFAPAGLPALLDRGPTGPLTFLGLHIAASLLFVPRTLLAFGAGLVFGMWWGTLWAALGSVLGAVAGLLVGRYLAGGLAERLGWTRAAPLLAKAESGGWRFVALLRLVPIVPHGVTNYALGLTRVRLGDYVLGSLLGQLPLTIAYVDFGAAGGRALAGTGDWLRDILWPSVIGVTALGLSLLIPLMLRRRTRSAGPIAGV